MATLLMRSPIGLAHSLRALMQRPTDGTCALPIRVNCQPPATFLTSLVLHGWLQENYARVKGTMEVGVSTPKVISELGREWCVRCPLLRPCSERVAENIGEKGAYPGRGAITRIKV